MRNAPAFALPIEFSANVEHGGYRWIDQDGKRLLSPSAPFERADWPDPFGRDRRTYYALTEYTGLFREFAGLTATETAIGNFADRYGLLGDGGNISIKTPFGQKELREETFEHWKSEIADLKWAVTLWDAVSLPDVGALKILTATLKLQRIPLAVRRHLQLEKRDSLTTALTIIRNYCDARLGDGVAPRLLFEGNTPRLRFSLQPENLRSALWLQFSVAIVGLKRFAKCQQCGAPFEVSRDPHTGKRKDAKFCRAACRVNHYRARVVRAQGLSAAGRPVEVTAIGV